MKKFLVLILALSSVSAFAYDVRISFTHFGSSVGSQSYYSCSYAEAQAEKWLDLFGATDVEVTCFGGIEDWRMSPVSIDARFNLPVLSGTEVAEVVKVRGDAFNTACGLNVDMVKTFVKYFPNVKILKRNDSCAFSSSNYSYEFSIVK